MMSQKYIQGRAVNLNEEKKQLMLETRTVPFIASTDAVDRHGTVINMDNWHLDAFKANPIAGYQHNVYGDGMCTKDSPDDIIGKWINIRIEEEDGKKLLKMDLRFKPEGRSELADKIFLDVVEGYLNAVSVGFISIEENGEESRMGDPSRGEDPNVKYFYGQELLEVSVVNIPANPEALRRSLRDQTSTALSFIQRKTGLRFSDIENMTVKDVLDALEGKKSWTETRTEETKEFIIDAGDNGIRIKENESEDSENSALRTAEARKRVHLLTIKSYTHG